MSRRILSLLLAVLPLPAHAGPTAENLAVPSPVNPRESEGQRFRCLVQKQLAECNGRFEKIAHVPDAEQVVIAPNGRVFVGGANDSAGVPVLAELLPDGTLQDVAGTRCTSHTGLEIRHEVETEVVEHEDGTIEEIEHHFYTLFAACFNASSVSVGRFPADAPAVITGSFPVTNAATPNGTALDLAGRFYVTNGPIGNNTPFKINRFTVTVAADGAVQAEEEDAWFAGVDGQQPFGINGLDHAVVDGVETLFFAEGGGISSLQIGPSGLPGAYRPLYYRLSHIDDLTVVEGDGIYFSDFFQGSYGKLGFDGNLIWETAIGTVMAGSHIVPVPGDANRFYVTDKGILNDPTEGRGNALGILTVDQQAIVQFTDSPL